MLEFIGLLIIGSFWIWGVNFAFREGQVFGDIGIYIRDYWPKGIYKPLIGCMPCMSSLHGILIYALYYEFSHLPYLPIFVFSLTGLNAILKDLIYAE